MTTKSGSQEVFASARSFGAVTPSDATELYFHGVYIGTSGTVVVRPEGGGTAVTFTVPDGFILPVHGDRIMAASTATNMVWLTW